MTYKERLLAILGEEEKINDVAVKSNELPVEECLVNILEKVQYEIKQPRKQKSSASTAQWIKHSFLKTIPCFADTRIREYTVDTLHICFSVFKEIIRLINEEHKYYPTTADFCTFIGCTTVSFNAWARGTGEKSTLINKVLDYLRGGIMQGMLHNEVFGMNGMFIGKADLGMREGDNQVNILNATFTETSIEDILKEYQANKIDIDRT